MWTILLQQVTVVKYLNEQCEYNTEINLCLCYFLYFEMIDVLKLCSYLGTM